MTRRGRLSRSAEFERVYRQGRSVGNRHLVLYAFPTAGGDRPRLGLSVSRKVGGAVHRNRVKRTLREAFALVEPDLADGQDVVVVARPEARDLAEREGLTGINRALIDLVDRAGLRRDAESVQLGLADASPSASAGAIPRAGSGPASAGAEAEVGVAVQGQAGHSPVPGAPANDLGRGGPTSPGEARIGSSG